MKDTEYGDKMIKSGFRWGLLLVGVNEGLFTYSANQFGLAKQLNKRNDMRAAL